MVNDEIEELRRAGSLTVLTRTIQYDKKGNVVSDTITDYINGKTYPTPKVKKNGKKKS